jgi:POT family proton-dependent oligopeptide transporter
MPEAAAVAESTPLPRSTAQDDLFGHPRGLGFLFATEMWERFSYYGMRALLVLYLVKYVLQPDVAGQVIGLAALKHGLEALLGPLDIQPFASNIYGLYTGLVYLTPIFGGIIADRVLGHRRTVVMGALLMALGHFMMAFEPLLLFALVALILGNGAFKPNMSSQVGELYAPGDPRRDRAYSIFYVGINIGAFFSPLVCGTLGERVGWHYGFGAAGVGMLIGLAIYLAGTSHLPPDPLFVKKAQPAAADHDPLDRDKSWRMMLPLSALALAAFFLALYLLDRLEWFPRSLVVLWLLFWALRWLMGSVSRDEWRSMSALLILFIPTSLFWTTYEQQGNTIALWADDYTDRAVNLWFWSAEIPTTWFQAFNPFMIFAFTPFVVALWARQAARGREPSTLIKMALGCAGCGAAYLIMAGAAFSAGDGKASWLWLFAFFAVVTTAELYLSPIGLSLVSKVAPVRYLSMMMGVWLATSFTGNFAAGYLGSFWSTMTKPNFFLMIAAIAIAAGAVIWAFDRPLRPALRQGA